MCTSTSFWDRSIIEFSMADSIDGNMFEWKTCANFLDDVALTSRHAIDVILKCPPLRDVATRNKIF